MSSPHHVSPIVSPEYRGGDQSIADSQQSRSGHRKHERDTRDALARALIRTTVTGDLFVVLSASRLLSRFIRQERPVVAPFGRPFVVSRMVCRRFAAGSEIVDQCRSAISYRSNGCNVRRTVCVGSIEFLHMFERSSHPHLVRSSGRARA
jgi:hypothetical protein